MATSHAKPLLGPQSVIPETRQPSPSILRKLSERDRMQLDRVLSNPVEFIGHESFAKARAARDLFGQEVRGERSTRPWCNAAEIDWSQLDTLRRPGDRLTIDQERRLFLRLNYARYRIFRLIRARWGKPLTARTTSELLWWSCQADEAKTVIVRSNMALVLAMAKRTRLCNVDYAELISEGNMALLRSVDKFDCARGFKFSTYACRAILKSFSRVALRTGRYRSRFPMEFDPSLEKSEYLEEQRALREAQCVEEIRGILHTNRAELNEVEATVIKARFAIEEIPGMSGDGPRTLEQVGLLIGVTKERVRQIQNRALAKLRTALQEDFLAA